MGSEEPPTGSAWDRRSRLWSRPWARRSGAWGRRSRRSGANLGQVQANSGRSWAHIRQSRPKFRRCRAKFESIPGRKYPIRRTSAQIGKTLVERGPDWADLGSFSRVSTGNCAALTAPEKSTDNHKSLHPQVVPGMLQLQRCQSLPLGRARSGPGLGWKPRVGHGGVRWVESWAQVSRTRHMPAGAGAERQTEKTRRRQTQMQKRGETTEKTQDGPKTTQVRPTRWGCLGGLLC